MAHFDKYGIGVTVTGPDVYIDYDKVYYDSDDEECNPPLRPSCTCEARNGLTLHDAVDCKFEGEDPEPHMVEAVSIMLDQLRLCDCLSQTFTEYFGDQIWIGYDGYHPVGVYTTQGVDLKILEKAANKLGLIALRCEYAESAWEKANNVIAFKLK